MNTISIARTVSTAVTPSERVLRTASMFGLGVDETRTIELVPPCEIPLPHLNNQRGIVFVTGPSGSGKSTILRLIAEACEALAQPATSSVAEAARVINFDHLPALPDVPLVDVFQGKDVSLERTMEVFSIVGLSDAFVMLRHPSELSDGQRGRLRLAHAMIELLHVDGAAAMGEATHAAAIIVADEFASTLDRMTAHTVARNVRRWVNRTSQRPLTFLAASAHDDLLESLEPDVLVWKGLGDALEVMTR